MAISLCAPKFFGRLRDFTQTMMDSKLSRDGFLVVRIKSLTWVSLKSLKLQAKQPTKVKHTHTLKFHYKGFG